MRNRTTNADDDAARSVRFRCANVAHRTKVKLADGHAVTKQKANLSADGWPTRCYNRLEKEESRRFVESEMCTTLTLLNRYVLLFTFDFFLNNSESVYVGNWYASLTHLRLWLLFSVLSYSQIDIYLFYFS